MADVSLDTSFLISFADPTRINHQTAVHYFDFCLANKIPMYLSAVAAGEFEIGQPLDHLPLQNFRLLSYNLLHAKRSASLFKLNHQHAPPVPDGTRSCIINDLKILAQAVEEDIRIILSEDENTLAKMTDRLRKQGVIDVHVLLLAQGFTPHRLDTPEQDEFQL